MFGQVQLTRVFQLSKLETVDEAVAKLDLPSPAARPMDGHTWPEANRSRQPCDLGKHSAKSGELVQAQDE
jgi:hypothetical protein